MKRNQGITLIALVITIIILIILAGISISLLMGEDGLITKAKQGALNYQNAALEEQQMLNNFYGDFATEIASTGSGDAAASLIAFKRTIATAITNAGVTTSENDSAETMATNIGQIAQDKYDEGAASVTALETPTLLWTNPSPNENFAGQRTIAVDTTQYQAFMIEYKNTKSGSEIGVVYIDNANYPKTYALYSFVPVSHNSRTVVVSSNGLNFGYNYDHTTNGGQYDESRNIPLRIWGYTNPIFTAE